MNEEAYPRSRALEVVMGRALRILMCAVLLLAPFQDADASGAVGHPTPVLALGHPIRFTDLAGGVPDSVRTHTLVLILRGEVAAAGDYYLLATGASQLPRWFTALQKAFDTASRAPNACQSTANAIAEGFRQLGQSPQLIRISSTAGDMRTTTSMWPCAMMEESLMPLQDRWE
ncbi:MAG TPA: hypothetical protein VFZ09_13225 [Archangium sp.]|uniref:hypothetical protein n=1 Tax=Archangium sp. TaxID=1872627 RepID=UPI002E371903|nr:hypothetical protein [Archangium sp.]HEX5747198.1 hypothetical protein [Archangium sp.]